MAKKLKIKRSGSSVPSGTDSTTKEASTKRIKKSTGIVVSLPGSPRVVIRDFESKEEAFEKYREVCGIVRSDHRPIFEPVNDQMTEDENGVLIDEHGRPEYASMGRKSISEDEEDFEVEG